MILLLSILLWAENPCFAPPFFSLKTEDDFHICVQHLEGKGHPVILAHGISSNHNFWNLNPQHSLALFLQQKGFDVYNIDFRGHGLATRDPSGKKQVQGWSVDSYGIDIQAIVQHIREQYPQKRPFYIGHSLGGLALITYLARYGSSALQGMIVVASPFDFRHPEPLLELAKIGAQISIFPIPTPLFAHIASLFTHTPAHIDTLLWGKDTISAEVRRELYQKIVSPMTPKELSHLANTLSLEAFSSVDGKISYQENLSTHDIPALFLAGRADRIAPVDRVMGYYNALGSKDKEFIILGKAYGFSIDYGHLDYPLARVAPKEVFPIIETWLNKKSPL
jgi:alpha-beta hydrolase superfamily lysophospholipase